jgi:hypothetical protein
MALSWHDVQVAQLPENKLARHEKLITQLEQLIFLRQNHIAKYGSAIPNIAEMQADIVNFENMVVEMKQEADELRRQIAERDKVPMIHPAYGDRHRVKISTYRRHLGYGSGK